MAIGTGTIADTAELLAGILAGIDGLRSYPYVADKFMPPGVIVGLPTIDYADPASGFCNATYDHELVLVVSRNQDLQAHRDLSKWLAAIAAAIAAADKATPAGSSIEVRTATPGPINVSGQELPGYTLRVLVRA